MRRYLVMMFILISLLACVIFTIPLFQTEATPSPTPLSGTNTPIPTTPTPIPVSPTSSASITATATPTIAATLTSPSLTPPSPDDSFTVLYHPDDALYIGDQVSFEVISPAGMDLKDASVQVQVDPPTGPVLDRVKFTAWGIQGRQEASFVWAWDTTDQAPGVHTLAFSIDPQGFSWTEQVTLLPTTGMPPSQAQPRWDSVDTTCCTVFYITHTASERDLPVLTEGIDEQAISAMDAMHASITEPITITLLPRLLGHGGFTSNEISVSYLDRNYSSNAWDMVVHHEMIHVIDAKLGGDFRPTIFVEGLATYMSGGHYKPEPLMPRAAALLPEHLGLYIPLKTLTDDFYASQHEIGYLEGASLIEYMVDIYGWQAFSAFYRDIHLENGQDQSAAIDAALQAHFSISLDELERGYLSALADQPDTAAWVDDVRLTVIYFDTLRRYQQLLDPSAYFRTAWLMDNQTMRQRGIVADYLRHPSTSTHLALETLFITAGEQLADQQFSDTDRTLGEIISILDRIEAGNPEPFSASSMAADYYLIADTLKLHGYEVQRIHLQGDTATVQATDLSSPDLLELHLQRTGDQWSISS